MVFKARACAAARFRVLAVIPAKAGIHLRMRVNTRRHFIPADAREP